MTRFVVSERDVPAQTAKGGTAEIRVMFDHTTGSDRLEQRVIRFRAGRSRLRRLDGQLEVLYVVSGSGALRIGDEEHELEPDSGVLVLPGESYEIESGGDLELVSVTASAEGKTRRERIVSRFADRAHERADENRTFRVLHQSEVTQFVGIIEPCRAPDHSHSYDEVGFIVEGRGLAHVGGVSTPIGPGSCFHLPAHEVHCIENTGPGAMRIMAVFHPSGSPKQRSYDR